MANTTLVLFENVEQTEDEFLESRFHKSIMFMHSITHKSAYMRDPQPVHFAVYRILNTENSFVCISRAPNWNAENEQLAQPAILSAMNLQAIREWRLIRRGSNVFFVGSDSEAVIADNVIPHQIRVEGGEDAERCWAINSL